MSDYKWKNDSVEKIKVVINPGKNQLELNGDSLREFVEDCIKCKLVKEFTQKDLTEKYDLKNSGAHATAGNYKRIIWEVINMGKFYESQLDNLES